MHIWKLILQFHRRKKHILWLLICSLIIWLCVPFIDGIALWEGKIVALSFQHQMTEIIGLLFILYFGSTTLQQFQQTKITQLLRSKKKEPIHFILQSWAGIYSIYAFFVIITLLGIVIIQGWWISAVSLFFNLLISGGIILSIIMILSLLTNSYITMVAGLIIYILSYSINFIIFSTPNSFKESLSFKVFLWLQYLFPRFDLLYSTLSTTNRWRAIGGNTFYGICVLIVLVIVFLHRYK